MIEIEAKTANDPLVQEAVLAAQCDVKAESSAPQVRSTLIATSRAVAVIATRVRYPRVLLTNGILAETGTEIVVDLAMTTKVEEEAARAVADETGAGTVIGRGVGAVVLLRGARGTREGNEAEAVIAIGIAAAIEAGVGAEAEIETVTGREAEAVEAAGIRGEIELRIIICTIFLPRCYARCMGWPGMYYR